MKRVLTFLALMLLPLSVMAMTPVSDSTLSDVTGQAGVNINANVTMNITMGTLAWGDSDGILGKTTATGGYGGFVGVNGLNIQNLVIKARTETLDTYGSYNAYSPSPTANRLQPITIDVARGTAINGGRTFVRIGLGSLQIKMDSLDLEVALGEYSTGSVTLNEIMGKLYIGDMNMYISPTSYVDIFSHTACGVSMNLNVLIDRFEVPVVSWGDSDGLAGGNVIANSGNDHYWFSGSNAGYVGLTGIVLNGLYVTGQVAIDVATASGGSDIYLEHYREKIAAYRAAIGAEPNYTTALANIATYVPGLSVVHLTFGEGTTPFSVGIDGYFRAAVKLYSTPQLNPAANMYGNTLGDIYVGGFNLDILPNSWVDIWAH